MKQEEHLKILFQVKRTIIKKPKAVKEKRVKTKIKALNWQIIHLVLQTLLLPVPQYPRKTTLLFWFVFKML